MTKTFAMAGILGLFMLLSACISGGSSTGQLQMAAADSDSTGRMGVGDTLIIELRGNPTTGYQWQLDTADTRVLEPQGEPDYAVSSNAMGAGGTYTFRFKAVASGQTTLRLVYKRPWEDSLSDETFEAVIIVKE